MRFETADALSIGHLVGEITCSYAQLVAKFGEPNGGSDGYKVSTAWVLKDTNNGQVFSIYDYKETSMYSQENPSVEKFRALPEYGWHIGAQSKVDAQALQAFVTG